MQKKQPHFQNIQSHHNSDTQKRVLIVEDDATHRQLMTKILEEHHFTVTIAEDGNVALGKLCADQPFDLIIMDWDMPELNGLQTTKKIREMEVDGKFPPTPVIAFTANRSENDREKCLAAGMNAYLPKDVWTPKWRQTLSEHLQKLIADTFQRNDIACNTPKSFSENFDLGEFDAALFTQTASLLKDDLDIAIDEYLEDAAAYIRDIRNGAETNDTEPVQRGSHTLKSNSKGFGLIGLAQITEAINTASRDGNMEAVKPLLPLLKEAFEQGKKNLKNALKDTL